MSHRASWGAATFERLYAESADPWDFVGSRYERAKYAATLAALPAARFDAGFEVGCSIGVLTAQLAARCDALLAVDIADAALRSAAARCVELPGVQFQRMQIPDDWPAASFDLIVLSETLYFLSPDDVARTARLVNSTLRPGGVALLVNWIGPTDTPCTGDEAAGLFIDAVPQLRSVSGQRAPRFRIDVLRAPG